VDATDEVGGRKETKRTAPGGEERRKRTTDAGIDHCKARTSALSAAQQNQKGLLSHALGLHSAPDARICASLLLAAGSLPSALCLSLSRSLPSSPVAWCGVAWPGALAWCRGVAFLVHPGAGAVRSGGAIGRGRWRACWSSCRMTKPRRWALHSRWLRSSQAPPSSTLSTARKVRALPYPPLCAFFISFRSTPSRLYVCFKSCLKGR
jgi:hypothetical protein